MATDVLFPDLSFSCYNPLIPLSAGRRPASALHLSLSLLAPVPVADARQRESGSQG